MYVSEPAWTPPSQPHSQRKTKTPLPRCMGHHWNEDMRCRHCGADWWCHDADPRPCLDSPETKPTPHRDENYRAASRDRIRRMKSAYAEK